MIKIDDLIKRDELNWFLSHDSNFVFKHFDKYTYNPSQESERFIYYRHNANRALVVATLDTFKSPTDNMHYDGDLLTCPTIHHRLGAYLATKVGQMGGFDLLLVDKIRGTIGSTARHFKSTKRYNFVCELGRAGTVSSTDGDSNRSLARSLDICDLPHNTSHTISSLSNIDLSGNPSRFILGLGYDKPYSDECNVDLQFAVEQIDRLITFKDIYGRVPFMRQVRGVSRTYSSRNTTYSYKPIKKDYTVYSCGCGAMYCAHELKTDKKCLACEADTVNINDKIMEVAK